MNICQCPKEAPGPYNPSPVKTLSKGWRSGQRYLKPQIYVEKPPNASVASKFSFRRWRVGEDTNTKKIQHSNENEYNIFNAAISRTPKTLKDERRKIKQNQREFYKAYKKRFGCQTPFSRITPNPLKINPSYNLVETASKRQIPYESAEKRRIRQQQIDFIREYERKAREERLSFQDIEQQNRIRQEQLDFIKEFDRKLEESYVLEIEAIDAAYEESVRQKQLQFRQKYEKEEAARRAAGLRSTATYAGTTSHARGVGYNKLTGPKIFREKPGVLSVKYHRWRAGETDTTSEDSIKRHIHNTPYIINTPIPKSPKVQEKEIRRKLQEFAKAYDQKIANQSTTTIEKHKKSRLSNQETKKVVQAPFENQQTDRIKQKQLDFIREFERKLKEEEEQKAAEARNYEESIWQQQVKFIKEFEEKERLRAIRERIGKNRASIQRKTKESAMTAKKIRREAEMPMKKRRSKKNAIQIQSVPSFEGETSYSYYDKGRANELLRKRQKEQNKRIMDWFYRCCCKVYCYTTLVLMVAVIVIVVI